MAVDREWRRKGVGGQILLFLEEEARAQGYRSSVLHAQEYVKSFYASHGYVEHGEVFLEVNIPHIEMRKEL
jgi:predicted GNAT family N-acyltransferase